MKTIIALLISALLFGCAEQQFDYTVKLTFCDSRPTRLVYVTSARDPSSRDIFTYKTAVPEWKGYLNVCEIEVIDKKPIAE